MLWFGKRNQKEIWEEDNDEPFGDIEAAQKIRSICNLAAGSAEKLAGFAERPSAKKKKYEAGRYDGAKKRALELAGKMSDDLLRDTAVRQIVNLCVTANDLKTASVLIGAIQTEKIRQEVLDQHPALR
jgi:hypothetical protein